MSMPLSRISRAIQSTANDPRLSTVITEREIAVSYISSANDFVTNGNYASARSKAEQAYTEANQSYNDALTFQAAVEATWNPFAGLGSVGSIFSSSVLVIVVGVVSCRVNYRRYHHIP